jgi:hypothetical protein
MDEDELGAVCGMIDYIDLLVEVLQGLKTFSFFFQE